MYEFLATLTLVLHFLFIIFVIFGALLFFIKRWVLYFHIPAFIYGAYMEFTQTICPLTYLENYLLTKANLATYSTTFIQNYLYSIIYPINLTKEIQISLGIALLIINGIIYGFIIKRKKWVKSGVLILKKKYRAILLKENENKTLLNDWFCFSIYFKINKGL